MSSTPTIHSTIAIQTNYVKPITALSHDKIKTMRAVLVIFMKIVLLNVAIALITTFAFSYLSPIILGYAISASAIVKFGFSVFLTSSVISSLIVTVQKALAYFYRKKMLSVPVPIPVPVPFLLPTLPLLTNNASMILTIAPTSPMHAHISVNPPITPPLPSVSTTVSPNEEHKEQIDSPIISTSTTPITSPRSDLLSTSYVEISPEQSPKSKK